jgi:hypothetical protein
MQIPYKSSYYLKENTILLRYGDVPPLWLFIANIIVNINTHWGPNIEFINLLKPSGFLRTVKFNIQKLYMVLALRWMFCTDLRTQSDFWLDFVTAVGSSYSVIRTDSLFKADCV